MASLTAGEPMGQRHGIALYSAQTTMGTPVTPATGIGIATLRWITHGDPHYFEGPGSPDPITMRPGASWVEWTLDFEAIQTGMKALLLKAQRAAGVVPMLTLGLGEADDTGTPVVAIDQIQDCKVERLTINHDVSNGHGPITGSMAGMGTLNTRLTAGAAALLNTTPWMTQDGVLTRGAAAFEARSLSIEVANTISRDYVLPGSAPANARIPKYLTEHGRSFSGELSRYAEFGIALQSATLAEAAMVYTLTNPVDSVALVFTFANQTIGQEEKSIGRDGVFYRAPWRARSLTIS